MQKPLSRDNGWQIWHRNMKLMSLSLLNILQNCILFQGHLGQRSRSKSHNIQKSAYFPFTTFHLYFMVPLKSYACIARIRTKTGPRACANKSRTYAQRVSNAHKNWRMSTRSRACAETAYLQFTTFHLYWIDSLKSYTCTARIRTKMGLRMRKRKSRMRTNSLPSAQKLAHAHSKSRMRRNCLFSIYHISLILNCTSQVLHVHSQNKDLNGTAHAQMKVAHAHKESPIRTKIGACALEVTHAQKLLIFSLPHFSNIKSYLSSLTRAQPE